MRSFISGSVNVDAVCPYAGYRGEFNPGRVNAMFDDYKSPYGGNDYARFTLFIDTKRDDWESDEEDEEFEYQDVAEVRMTRAETTELRDLLNRLLECKDP